MSDGPVHRVISAAEVYSFPQGHLGHLTDLEANALDEFRKLCTEKNLYTGTKKYDFGFHDDTTLLFVKSFSDPRVQQLISSKAFLESKTFQCRGCLSAV